MQSSVCLISTPPLCHHQGGCRAVMVEGWGVYSPIMPSGTIMPVTFRNLTFSTRQCKSAEEHRRQLDRLSSSRLSPSVALKAAVRSNNNSIPHKYGTGKMQAYWLGGKKAAAVCLCCLRRNKYFPCHSPQLRPGAESPQMSKTEHFG